MAAFAFALIAVVPAEAAFDWWPFGKKAEEVQIPDPVEYDPKLTIDHVGGSDRGLDKALREVVHGEPRCALDPGCTRNGSACAVCLHVGEPSCRYYNQFLARTTLFGPSGYLTP